MNQFEYWLKLAERGSIGTEGFWQSYVDQIYAASMASVWTFAILGLLALALLVGIGIAVYRRTDDDEVRTGIIVGFAVVGLFITIICALIIRDGYVGAQSPAIRAIQSLRIITAY